MFHVPGRKKKNYDNNNEDDETFVETYSTYRCISKGTHTDRGIYTGRLLLGGWVSE